MRGAGIGTRIFLVRLLDQQRAVGYSPNAPIRILLAREPPQGIVGIGDMRYTLARIGKCGGCGAVFMVGFGNETPRTVDLVYHNDLPGVVLYTPLKKSA